jgi:Carboxypeptidase regulatory-like domain/TonB-dependent Receptor Plug Domain
MKARAWLVAAALAATASGLGEVQAQTVVHGKLVDDATEQGIAGGQVSLVGSEGRSHRAVTTDAQGRFFFDGITPGPMRMRAQQRGFESAFTPFLQTAPGDTVELEIRLAREAVLLAPLTVVGRSERRESIQLQGFYQRLAAGFGSFVTRDDIQRRNPLYASDMLLTVPGVRLGNTNLQGRRTLTSTRSLRLGGACPMQIFVDGFHVNRRRPRLSESLVDSAGTRVAVDDSDPGLSLDEFVSAGELEGIEVYKGASDTPAEFWSPDAVCGTIVVWTRRGR